MPSLRGLFDFFGHTKEQPIRGTQIGRRVKHLGHKMTARGCDPIRSIQIRCSACSTPIPLTRGPSFLGSELCFAAPDGTQTDLTDALCCFKCGSDRFYMEVGTKDFADVVREAIDALPRCEDDPAEGLRCDETGGLIANHRFTASSDFNQLWSQVSRWMQVRWGLNDHYSFDMIVDRIGRTHYIKKIHGVLHYNQDQNCRVLIFRDTLGVYWHYHE